MVFAAGLGTRLRPLTNDRPKALVEIGGRTLLEIVLSRLRIFGVGEVIVNTHHFADEVAEYLKARNNFGIRIEISREETLLDTGGGLKKAAWFFEENASSRNEPFFVHNVDVISTIDLARMLRFHLEHDALATLAVQKRTTSRPLLFDESGVLCGRRAGMDGEAEMARPAEKTGTLAFAGIHVISPKIFAKFSEAGVFPIVPAYLRLVSEGERIVAFCADDSAWRDVGTPESMAHAEREMKGEENPST